MTQKFKIDKIEDLYEYLWKTSAEMVAKKETQIPLMMMFPEKGDPVFIPISGMDADLCNFLMREASTRAGMRVVALVAEAWMAKVRIDDLEDVLGKASVGGVEDLAGAEEIVRFDFMTSGRAAVMLCRIDRKTNTLEKKPFIWMDEAASSLTKH